MHIEIVIALITLGGSFLGTIGGILINGKLINHRLEQLEKKVEKHNSVMEKTIILERDVQVANHRIRDLEEKVG